jgi:hypothetical protein
MAADEKKTKPKEKIAPKEKPAAESPAKDKTAADAATVNDVKTEAKAEAKTEAPKDYSRGEGQKPVSQAYKDNWDAIFGKKPKKKKR